MQILPYVFYDGRCEEAIAFYKKAVGAEVKMLTRFSENPDLTQKDCPDGTPTPVVAPDKVMHADVSIGGSSVLMSDGHAGGQPRFEGFGLSLTVADEAEAKRCFDGLVQGGTVVMPLGKTFFSPSFGMLNDPFGVMWMVYVAPGR